MMRNLLTSFGLLLSVVLVISCKTDVKYDTKPELDTSEIHYDSILAQKYGADAYGMKKYVMAFLKKGPNRDLPEEEANALQQAHMNHIGKMAEEGKLVVAGPFFGDGDLRGIYVFNVSSIEEAEKLTAEDPAVKAGSLKMELIEWYCSAALMGVNEVHETLSKKNITE